MKIVHIELREANEYIANNHRHHKPVVGHRFSLGAALEGDILGVAICGRPVARGCDPRRVVEVTRLCTRGGKNVCSFLYGAAARASKALGYQRIQTYILESETGVSLKAAGWKLSHTTAGGSWNRYGRKGKRRTDQPECPKELWYKDLT